MRKVLDFFPGEISFFTAKVSVLGSLFIDGALESEFSDQTTRSQVEVSQDDILQVFIGESVLNGAHGVDINRNGLGHADTISHFDSSAVAEAVLHEGLGHPTHSISSGTVHLGRVLSGESTATMATPAAVSVHDDLAASEAGVTSGTADDEASRGIYVKNRLLIYVFGRNHVFDYLFFDLLLDFFVSDGFGVLDTHEHSMHANGDDTGLTFLVLHGDLSLVVGHHPGEDLLVHAFAETSAEIVGVQVGEGHTFFGLVGGVTDHKALVTGTQIFFFVIFSGV